MFFHPLQASLHVELEKAGKLLNIEMKKSFFFPGGNSENEHLPGKTGGRRGNSESCQISPLPAGAAVSQDLV